MLRGGADVTRIHGAAIFRAARRGAPCTFSFPCLRFICGWCRSTAMHFRPARRLKPAAERKTMPFLPNFLRKDLAMWIISLNVLALLASVFPWQLGKAYDALAPAPMGIHPEWYFMSPFEMLKLLGSVLPGEAGEIAGLLSVHIGHCALDPDSVLRQGKGIRPPRAHCALFRPAGRLRPAGDHGDWVLDDSVRKLPAMSGQHSVTQRESALKHDQTDG